MIPRSAHDAALVRYYGTACALVGVVVVILLLAGAIGSGPWGAP